MAHGVCPPWVGYLLLNPIRRWVENPEKILGPLVEPGMRILEPGCGMGYFTLPLARMTGDSGKVIAVDLQARMLEVLAKRARRAGLLGRIELRHAESDTLNIADLTGSIDLALAIHMVHEMPDQAVFFEAMRQVLKPSGRLLVIEPKGHVTIPAFETTITIAGKTGFRRNDAYASPKERRSLFHLQL